MASNDLQIVVNRGFSGENLPCSRLQKINQEWIKNRPKLDKKNSKTVT